jgi:polar amino acid transport system substrate-binding protein
MKNLKNILIVLVIGIVLVALVAIVNKNGKSEISEEVEKEKLIMVTEAGFAPYEFYDGEEIVGVDVEIAKKIAEKTGKELVIKDTDFDSLINEVKTGKADFAAAGLSITPERLDEVDFSIEYAVSKQVIVVKNESKAETIEDFNGKKVAVQLGTIADLVLSDENPEVELVQHKKYLLAVEDLKADKVEAIVLDSLPAQEIVAKNPEFKILEKELLVDKYGIAVQKGNKELLEDINTVLKELMDNNKIEDYTVKFLGE